MLCSGAPPYLCSASTSPPVHRPPPGRLLRILQDSLWSLPWCFQVERDASLLMFSTLNLHPLLVQLNLLQVFQYACLLLPLGLSLQALGPYLNHLCCGSSDMGDVTKYLVPNTCPLTLKSNIYQPV